MSNEHPIDAQIKIMSMLLKLGPEHGRAIAQMNPDRAVAISAFQLVLSAGLKHHLNLDTDTIKKECRDALEERLAHLDEMEFERGVRATKEN